MQLEDSFALVVLVLIVALAVVVVAWVALGALVNWLGRQGKRNRQRWAEAQQQSDKAAELAARTKEFSQRTQ